MDTEVPEENIVWLKNQLLLESSLPRRLTVDELFMDAEA
jgi:hypothetical protein